MSQRLNISSGSPFEDTFGYCRAVKTGNLLEISGTVAIIVIGEVVSHAKPELWKKIVKQSLS